MVCRPRPGAAATLQERVLPGEKILVAGQALVGTTSWYNDGFRTLTNRDCWLYGPGTVEFNEEQPGPGWVVMLDHVLARNDVTCEEYVDVDSALQAADSPQDRKAIEESGLIQFRRFQMIERMLGRDDAGNDAVNGNPLKRAWILGHKDLVRYDEPSGHWVLRSEPYRELLERHKSEAWAEEIAWAIATLASGGDECDSNRMLEYVVDRPVWYLSRYPSGAHAQAAMKDAMETASQAAGMACSMDLPPDWRDPVKHDVVQKIRNALAKIALPGRQEILRSLDEAERNCEKAK
jgi:hypothetical protein